MDRRITVSPPGARVAVPHRAQCKADCGTGPHGAVRDAAPAHANEYLRKHQLASPQIAAAPSPALGMAVVIPCCDEPELLTTLAALRACARPGCHVEVIVVVNAPEGSAEAVRARNRRTREEASAWGRRHDTSWLAFHVVHHPALPARHAGVGLARKLGMDEAVARFHRAGARDGIIVCLDADCTCEAGYLRAIEGHFARHPATPACTIHFEHPLEGDPAVRAGIARYELYLRYCVQGLRHSGFPYAHHTVGSAMAVRRRAYERVGGMNRRQGGEDFYFLHKLMGLGGFSALRDTTVVPSARASGRVPFGTGAAMGRWLAGGAGASYPVYAPAAFRDLRVLFERLDALHAGATAEAVARHLAPPLAAYLSHLRFPERLVEIRANTASAPAFRKRFFAWFNALRIYQYARRVSADHYGWVEVASVAATLLRWQGVLPAGCEPDVLALLRHYRRMDREGCGIEWAPSTGVRYRFREPVARPGWGTTKGVSDPT